MRVFSDTALIAGFNCLGADFSLRDKGRIFKHSLITASNMKSLVIYMTWHVHFMILCISETDSLSPEQLRFK
jgi:hypothetical protein